jgi:hypothetical protein
MKIPGIAGYGWLIVLFLPGCGCRVFDWARDSIHQGLPLPDHTSKAYDYVRSVSLYDQFTLLASFDALWLSDVVRTAYADICALKTGKNEEQKNAFLRRQLAENEHFIIFYVLSLYEVPLREKDASWGIFLSIDGVQYAPTVIKAIDMAPEYEAFFGESFTRFKVAYEVVFNANDMNGCLLMNEQTKYIELVFRSVDKEGSLSWILDPAVCTCRVNPVE